MPEGLISTIMPLHIVNLLEKIDVHHGNRNRPAFFYGLIVQSNALFKEITAVIQLGEIITAGGVANHLDLVQNFKVLVDPAKQFLITERF